MGREITVILQRGRVDVVADGDRQLFTSWKDLIQRWVLILVERKRLLYSSRFDSFRRYALLGPSLGNLPHPSR